MLISLDDKDVESVGLPLAERLLVEAKSVDALERSAMFLLEHKGELPVVKTVPAPQSVSREQARMQAQQLAIRMLACDMRGGCGPGGFQTALYCGSNCRAGTSLDQIWAKTNSPEAIAYARAIAKAISDSRLGTR